MTTRRAVLAMESTVWLGALIIVLGALSACTGVEWNGGNPGRPAPSHSAPTKPTNALENCLRAADAPDPLGYAPEVCEPLSPSYQKRRDVIVEAPMCEQEDDCYADWHDGHWHIVYQDH